LIPKSSLSSNCNRLATAVVFALLGVLFGCTGSIPLQVYPGATLPNSEISKIRVMTAEEEGQTSFRCHINSVDDKYTTSFLENGVNEVSVLPGTHRMEVIKDNNAGQARCTLEIIVEKGESYIIKTSKNGIYFTFWVENERTGMKVSKSVK